MKSTQNIFDGSHKWTYLKELGMARRMMLVRVKTWRLIHVRISLLVYG